MSNKFETLLERWRLGYITRETLRGWAMVVAAGMIAITMMAIHRGRMPLRLMLRSLAGKALTMR